VKVVVKAVVAGTNRLIYSSEMDSRLAATYQLT
jgi:hypothetical protein